MPAAPLCSANSAAATGSGSNSLRAFRRVAMWSILTANLISDGYGSMVNNRQLAVKRR